MSTMHKTQGNPAMQALLQAAGATKPGRRAIDQTKQLASILANLAAQGTPKNQLEKVKAEGLQAISLDTMEGYIALRSDLTKTIDQAKQAAAQKARLSRSDDLAAASAYCLKLEAMSHDEILAEVKKAETGQRSLTPIEADALSAAVKQVNPDRHADFRQNLLARRYDETHLENPVIAEADAILSGIQTIEPGHVLGLENGTPFALTVGDILDALEFTSEGENNE